MATLSDQKIELAIYGYIRKIQLSSDIPDVIKDVIIEFAKFYFNWKDSKYGNENGGFKFNDEDPIRIIKPAKGWQILAMNDVLSLKTCKIFEWELQIIRQIDDFP